MLNLSSTRYDLALSPGISLILGGARCGKSLFAEQLVEQAEHPIYLATAEAQDREMKNRITEHQKRRKKHWTTIEEPLALTQVLRQNTATNTAILVDCLTLWLCNLMCRRLDLQTEITSLVNVLPNLSGSIVFVTNEVGLGIIPNDPLSRNFRDEAGCLHQKIAAHASTVCFMVAGLPIILRQSPFH